MYSSVCPSVWLFQLVSGSETKRKESKCSEKYTVFVLSEQLNKILIGIVKEGERKNDKIEAEKKLKQKNGFLKLKNKYLFFYFN